MTKDYESLTEISKYVGGAKLHKHFVCLLNLAYAVES